MKKILALYTFVMAISACTTDSYEVGDNDLSYMHVDFADVRRLARLQQTGRIRLGHHEGQRIPNALLL